MAQDPAPDDIVQLANARAAARRARDWTTADDLRARIEAAGWKVIDVGTLYDLERAAPADIRDGGTIRYGASSSVPSRLGETSTGLASVVLLATDWPEDVERTVGALAATSPAGTQVIVVANGESEAQAASLAALEEAGPLGDGVTLEVIRTSSRLGFATALNAGIRRAESPVVVVMDTSVEPQGNLITPLVAALGDPRVAVAGPFGVVSEDLRRFTEPAAGIVEVDAIEGYAMAFRRADYAARGPLDEHFVFFRHLDLWWSLVLRDQGEDDPDDAAPRRAVRVAGIAIQRHPHREWASLADQERDRLSKRNFYRVLKRFASRRDLLVGQGIGERGA
ncbi:MAG: glycosyltransferase [Chloroflexi bacterium]|nr:glycosyltransferase [Chloroflexota bacterium]